MILPKIAKSPVKITFKSEPYKKKSSAKWNKINLGIRTVSETLKSVRNVAAEDSGGPERYYSAPIFRLFKPYQAVLTFKQDNPLGGLAMNSKELEELKKFILHTSLAQGFATYLALKYADELPSFTPGEVGSLHSELQFYRTILAAMLSKQALHPVEEEFPEVYHAREIPTDGASKIYEGILAETLDKVRST